jgi:hypothetical protein
MLLPILVKRSFGRFFLPSALVRASFRSYMWIVHMEFPERRESLSTVKL